MNIEPQPAATVAPLRDGPRGLEVLLLQRSPALVFAPGAWVFPGGRIDSDDHRHGAAQAPREAAVREAWEEAGIALVAQGLVQVAHWTTPPGQVRRFATWFFVADANHCHAVRIDGVEAVDFRWLRPDDALAQASRGGLHLIRPTLATLEQLREFTNVAEALGAFADRPTARC